MSDLNRDVSIDALRGLAALTVAAFHTREVTWIGFRQFVRVQQSISLPEKILDYLTFPLVWGAIGVPIFFVLSGYCIHRSQASIRARSGTFSLSTTQFFARRFFRIYPVLVGALVVTFVCDALSAQFFPVSYKLGDTGLHSLLINLASLQGIVGAPYGSNLALWTLSIEVQFYVFYPVLVYMMAWLGNIRTLLLLLLLNLASYLVLERHGIIVFTSYYVSWYLGALIAEAEANGSMFRSLMSSRSRILCCGLSAGVFCGGCATNLFDQFAAFQSWAADFQFAAFQLWAVAFALMLSLVLIHVAAQPNLVLRLFGWLGTFSFSLYIIHLPLVVLFNSVFFNSHKQVSVLPFLGLLVLAIGSAYVFYFVVEKPALFISHWLRTPSTLLQLP